MAIFRHMRSIAFKKSLQNFDADEFLVNSRLAIVVRLLCFLRRDNLCRLELTHSLARLLRCCSTSLPFSVTLFCALLFSTWPSDASAQFNLVRFKHHATTIPNISEGGSASLEVVLSAPAKKGGADVYFSALDPHEFTDLSDNGVNTFYVLGENPTNGRTDPNNRDFTPHLKSRKITIPEGETTGRIEISVLNDAVYEGYEYFVVRLEDDISANTGVVRRAYENDRCPFLADPEYQRYPYGIELKNFHCWSYIYRFVKIRDSSPTPTFEVRDVLLDEGESIASYKVYRNSTVAVADHVQSEITLSSQPSDPQTAIPGTDYSTIDPVTFVINNDNVNSVPDGDSHIDEFDTSIQVITAEDDIDERTETFTISIEAVKDAAVEPGKGTAIISIRDDDLTTLSLTPATRSIGEGDSALVELKLGRSLFAGEKVVVPLSVTGSAEIATDFLLRAPANLPDGIHYDRLSSHSPHDPPTITFTGPSAVSAPIHVTALTDSLESETEEQFTLQLPQAESNVKQQIRFEGFDSDDGVALKQSGGADIEFSTTVTITNDEQTPRLTIEDASGPEGQAVEFVAKLSRPLVGDSSVQVAWTVTSEAADTAAPNQDYRQESGTVVFRAGETEKTIEISTFLDDLQDEGETFTVSLSVERDGPVLLDSGVAQGTIEAPANQRVASITSSSSGSNSLTEGSPVSFSVRLSQAAPSGGVTVHYKTVDGRGLTSDAADQIARAGEDYLAPLQGTSLFIPAGQSESEFSIRTLGDDEDEPLHYFTVQLVAATDSVISAAANLVVVSLEDDAGEMPVYSISTTQNSTVIEGEPIKFKVTMQGDATGAPTVVWHTTSLTAKGVGNDRDYRDSSTVDVQTRTLSASPDNSWEIVIDTFDDQIIEEDETFEVWLHPGLGARVAPDQGKATGTILDDDKDSPNIRIISALGDEKTGTLILDVVGDPGNANMVIAQPRKGSARQPLDPNRQPEAVDGKPNFDVVESCSPNNEDLAIKGNFSSNKGPHTKAVLLAGKKRHRVTFGEVCSDGNLDEPTEYRVLEFVDLRYPHIPMGNRGKRFRQSVEVLIEDNDPTSVILQLQDSNARAIEGNSGATRNQGYTDFWIDLGSSSALADRRPLLQGEQLVIPLQITGGQLGQDYTLKLMNFSGTGPAKGNSGISFDSTSETVTFTGRGTVRPQNAATIKDRSRARLRLRALKDSNTVDEVLTIALPHSDTQGTPSMTAIGLGGGAQASMPSVDERRITLQDDPSITSPYGNISVSDTTVAEGEVATFAVTLDQPQQNKVSVRWSAHGAENDRATAGADYQTASGTLTFAVGEVRKTFDIVTLSDSNEEQEETFTVTLTGATGANLGDATGIGSITVPKEHLAQVFLVSDANRREGGRIEFEVRLTQPAPSSGMEVFWKTQDGRGISGDNLYEIARAGEDYNAVNGGKVTVIPGQSSARILVQTTPDKVFEGPHWFTVKLLSADGGGLDASASSVAVAIDDSEDLPKFSIAATSALEGNELEFTLTKTGETLQDSSVFWSTADASVDSATANVDYASVASQQVIFGPSETSKQIVVKTTQDDVDEGDENVQVILKTGLNAVLDPALATVSGTIVDDDASFSIEDASAPEGEVLRFRVVRSQPYRSSQNVHETIRWMLDSQLTTATADSDFTGAALYRRNRLEITSDEIASQQGQRFEKYIEIPLLLDGQDDAGEKVVIRLLEVEAKGSSNINSPATKLGKSSAVGTILAPPTRIAHVVRAKGQKNPSAGGEPINFTIILSEPAPAGGATVLYDAIGIDPVLGYRTSSSAHFKKPAPDSSIVIPEGQTQGSIQIQTVRVEPGKHNRDTAVRLILKSVTGYTVVNQKWVPSSVTIYDTDPFPVLKIAGTASAVEGDDVEFTVTKVGDPDISSVLVWQTADTTPVSAVAGKDYLPFSYASTRLGPGETTKTIRIATLDNDDYEPDRTFAFNIFGAGAATLEPDTPSSIIVTILNDERGLTIADAVTTEGSPAVFKVSLTEEYPWLDSAPVTVNWRAASVGTDTATEGSDFDTATGTLTFQSGETEQFIRIATHSDSVDDIGESFTVTLSDAAGAVIADSTAAGLIGAPAARLAGISAPAAPVTEGSNAEFVISLSAPAGAGGATIAYETLDGRSRSGDLPVQVAIAGDDYTPASSGASVLIAEGDTRGTISIPVIDDQEYERGHWFTVQLVSATGAGIDATSPLASVEISDENDLPQFSVSDTNVREGAALNSFVITKTGATNFPASVSWNTVASTPESAIANVDYVEQSGEVVTFAAYETEKSVPLTISDDSEDESVETFGIELTTTTASVLGASTTATVALVDNDATDLKLEYVNSANYQLAEAVNSVNLNTGAIKLTLSKALKAGETVIVPLAVSGTGISGDDYTISLQQGGSLNQGVTLDTTSQHSAASPAVVFNGPHAQVANLELSVNDDNLSEGYSKTGVGNFEYLLIDFGSAPRTVSSNLDHFNGFHNGGVTTSNSATTTDGSFVFTFSIKDDDSVAANPSEVQIVGETLRTITEGQSETFSISGSAPGTLNADHEVAYDVTQSIGGSIAPEVLGRNHVRISGTPQSEPEERTQYAGSFLVAPNNDAVSEPDGVLKVDLLDLPNYSLSDESTSALVLVKDDDPLGVTFSRPGIEPGYETQPVEVTVTLDRPLAKMAHIQEIQNVRQIVEVDEQITVPVAVNGLPANSWSIALKQGNGINTGVTLVTASPWSTSKPAVTFSAAGSEAATLVVTANDSAVSGVNPVALEVTVADNGLTSNLSVDPVASGIAAIDLYDQTLIPEPDPSTIRSVFVEAQDDVIERIAGASVSFVFNADAPVLADTVIKYGVQVDQVENHQDPYPPALQNFGFPQHFGGMPIATQSTGRSHSIVLPKGSSSVKLDIPVTQVGVDAQSALVQLKVFPAAGYRTDDSDADIARVIVKDVVPTPISLAIAGAGLVVESTTCDSDDSNSTDSCAYFKLNLDKGGYPYFDQHLMYQAKILVTSGAGVTADDYQISGIGDCFASNVGQLTRESYGYLLEVNSGHTNAGNCGSELLFKFQAARDNDLTEQRESVQISLGQVLSNFNEASAKTYSAAGVLPSNGSITVNIDPSAILPSESAIEISKSELIMVEGGNVATYTIAPNRAPDSDVTVTVRVADKVEILSPRNGSGTWASERTVTMTPADGKTAHTITLRYKDDSIDSPKHKVSVTHTVSQSGATPYFDGVKVQDLELVLIDNDPTKVTLEVHNKEITENTDSGWTKVFSIDTGRPLVAGETLTVPVFFELPADGVTWKYRVNGHQPNQKVRGVKAIGQDPIVLTFTGSKNTSQTAQFELSVSDENIEHTTGVLSIPSSATVGQPPLLVPSGLHGGAAGVRVGDGQVRIINSDRIEVYIHDGHKPVRIKEDGSMVLDFRLSQPAPKGGLKFFFKPQQPYGTAEESLPELRNLRHAKKGEHFVDLNHQVFFGRFAEGSTRNVSVIENQILANGVYDGPVWLRVSLLSVSGSAVLAEGPWKTARAFIIDDEDQKPVLRVKSARTQEGSPAGVRQNFGSNSISV